MEVHERRRIRHARMGRLVQPPPPARADRKHPRPAEAEANYFAALKENAIAA